MTVSPEEVRHIARLARLELSDGEVERFRRELTTILAYVEKLEELEAAPAAEPAEPDQPLRDDVLAPWPDVAALHAAAALQVTRKTITSSTHTNCGTSPPSRADARSAARSTAQAAGNGRAVRQLRPMM